MPPKRKRKATKAPPEVWVSPDLMQKLKGVDGHRGVHVPQSPFLALADRFLGMAPGESAGKPAHRASAAHPASRTREAAAAPEPPTRVMAAAAGAGTGPDGVSTTLPPRPTYPHPPLRSAPPRPPKLAVSRPNPPKLQPPKPPKLSFAYRRRKVDPVE